MKTATQSFIALATELIIDGDTITQAIDKVFSLGGKFELNTDDLFLAYDELKRRHPFANKEPRKCEVINILYEALLEASNLFDNYPEMAKENIGTFEVVNEAIEKAKGCL